MILIVALRRFKEAVNECSSALDAVPAYHKALVRRAKAYEQMGHFKQALSDIQKANKADTANPETQVAALAQSTCCSALLERRDFSPRACCS
jgi:tetratricopeptide (TPR) repeat protein